MSGVAIPLMDRFWTKVDKTGDCWMWTACRDRQGYGQIDAQRAHRVAYADRHGPIPAGMYVLHSCDNPPCVNPAHLRLGTHEENMREMVERARHSYLRRTHCPHGHEYTPENTYIHKGRHCRACNRRAAARAAARRKTKGVPA
jgi:hypothetical protein